MWPKLRKQIAIEREQLRRLVESHRPLLLKCASASPDTIELSALAALLHSFYGGVENLFKRVTIELGETLPHGEAWHRQLLENMTKPGAERPPVISRALAQSLEDYLDFRHFFRHAYVFQLNWAPMAHLARGLDGTLGRIESELDEFLRLTSGGK